VAERLNRTLLNLVRAMLHSARLPQSLWADALEAAVYLRNRSITRAVTGMTPYEAWHGIKPDVSNLRSFGCLAYPHIQAQQRQGKMSDRARPCALVGYSDESKGWLLWDPASRIVHDSRDVKFYELLRWHEMPLPAGRGGARPTTSVSTPSSSLTDAAVPVRHNLRLALHAPAVDSDDESDDYQDNQGEEAANDAEPSSPPGVADEPLSPASAPAPALARLPMALRKLQDHIASGRRDTAPSSLGLRGSSGGDDMAALLADGNQARQDDPATLREALSRPDAQHWKAAAQAEYDSLQEAKTYDLVELPRGRSAVGNKWVLKLKELANGDTKYKGRLVAKGFTQKYGIDYDETYSPVVRYASLRALLALAAHHDWEVHHMDVKTAYLNGVLQEEIYMRQPEGFEVPGKEHLVCRLKKGLYGLKQAGRAWYQTIDPALQRLGLTALHSDHCVYIYRQRHELLILSLYVDDLFLFTPSLALLRHFKQQLQQRFRMEDLGEVKLMLGMHVQRDRTARTLTISQQGYVERVLERLNAPVNPTATPMEHGPQPRKAAVDHSAVQADVTRYQTAIGALMYAACGTRPDIAFAVQALSRHSANPDEGHWTAVKRLLRYLRGSAECSLSYVGVGPKDEQPQLTCYSDSDYAGCEDDRKSVTGYTLTLCGGAINWASRKQKTTAQSTVEAEYMAIAEALKDVIWWRQFLGELGYDISQPTPILGDNMGSLALAANPGHHERTKHIDVKYHLIREHLTVGAVTLKHVATQLNAADLLTKALPRDKHNSCMTLLGMTPP
jgi:hypothetical protein